MITHAGCLVFKTDGNDVFFLLITSSDSENWVLPKGHIEEHESPEEAALRELKEEAGVLGIIVEKLSVQTFEKPKETATVQYYLIKAIIQLQPKETRKILWLVEDEVIKYLSFEDSKTIFLEGARAIRYIYGTRT
jgi:8-oxo-dGTP pyrophosphatase MutT (NUDIX family)